jgi:hypothetical protein
METSSNNARLHIVCDAQFRNGGVTTAAGDCNMPCEGNAGQVRCPMTQDVPAIDPDLFPEMWWSRQVERLLLDWGRCRFRTNRADDQSSRKLAIPVLSCVSHPADLSYCKMHSSPLSCGC